MLNGSLDLANDVFNLSLCLCLVVFFLANVLLNNILNNDAHLRGVESKKNQNQIEHTYLVPWVLNEKCFLNFLHRIPLFKLIIKIFFFYYF